MTPTELREAMARAICNAKLPAERFNFSRCVAPNCEECWQAVPIKQRKGNGGAGQ